MKLVLLPGLHGTGRLFEPFIDALNDKIGVSAIELPSGENQSYEFLTDYVRRRVPRDDEFVLLAESFSGPVAYRLLQDEIDGLVSVVFVVSFIKRPSNLAGLAALVPNFVLRRSFVTDLAVKALLTGFDAGAELINEFWAACDEAGVGTIKQRLKSVASLPKPTRKISSPCFYIQAKHDFLVPAHNYLEFQKQFENIKLYRIKGRHLILQTRPEECAKAVCGMAGL